MDIKPIVGRTHTDLFKTRNRLTNIGGRGGINLTFFTADGYSYVQIGVLALSLLVWTLPLVKIGVPVMAWGGMSLLLLFGPPIALAWASDRRMPNGKSFLEWVTTRYRYHFQEKRHYVAGRPATTTRVSLEGLVWTPPKEGLRD